MNSLSNGQARKTLSEQLDRLDRILGGLPDSLRESVASAVKEATAQAVQQAVQATLTEILTSPELLGLIGASRAPATESTPPPPDSCQPGLRDRVGSALSWAGQKVRSARDACARKLSCMLGLWGLRRQMMVSLGVGAAAGLAAYAAGPVAASVLAATVSFTSSFASRARFWLRRAVTRVPFAVATP